MAGLLLLSSSSPSSFSPSCSIPTRSSAIGAPGVSSGLNVSCSTYGLRVRPGILPCACRLSHSLGGGDEGRGGNRCLRVTGDRDGDREYRGRYESTCRRGGDVDSTSPSSGECARRLAGGELGDGESGRLDVYVVDISVGLQGTIISGQHLFQQTNTIYLLYVRPV
ncbi:hypothetical protein RHS04_06449 [Rhizoctonia solani]|uniref:Uncharacterized protein n=1 Tax=Rhizoctonia solani TaxID=456999 RepID=A0A8H7H4Y8_9AGAM|nr:hypothetical protein RHS04_06449 [Rhizoctonia solani]